MAAPVSQARGSPSLGTEPRAVEPAGQPRASVGRRFLRRLLRNRAAGLGAIYLLAVGSLAVFAPWIAPYDPYEQNLLARLQPPSVTHWLGTDELGRDVFSRIAYGGRVSLLIGIFGSLGGLIIGVILGALAGYRGGWIDNLVMRLIDIMMSFPGVLLAILIASVLGPGLINLVVALAIWFTPTFARITRGGILAIKSTEFVEAARSLGANSLRILCRHMLINTLSPIIVYLTLSVATSILVAAGLSFLGLGVQPPTPEWGAMVGAARRYLRDAPHLITFPGLAIFFTVLSINMIGDALRDVLDPRLRT